MGSFAELSQYVLHLVTLGLGADVRSEALLDELEGLLILGDLEQLHRTLLVGGETSDLTDQLADDLKIIQFFIGSKTILTQILFLRLEFVLGHSGTRFTRI